MTAPVTLLMAVHCHQPVGNFHSVIEDAYAKAYEPFVQALERHPSVRLALHYSGPLLEWLAANRPEFVARVRNLARRGQIELLASGYGEPILPLLPEADRQGQIALMRATLRKQFGSNAEGLWLTERVWEPDLPSTLSRAGIRYTMLDVNQFLPVKPWLPSGASLDMDGFWDAFGSYITEAGGGSVRIFPSSKRLRYWLPFQPADRTLEFLRGLRRDEPVAITFADDGEKFGLWPNTYRWVHEEGWLESFFGMLEREQGWLATGTFGDYAARTEPLGRVYLPCGSYDEMLEWSGGFFRNFFVKYPEANAMQQKMLEISGQLRAIREAGLASPALLRRASRELYLGQCNCAYWHGVFGGLYLAHLRRAVYRHLIAAEALLHRAAKRRASVSAADADGDGRMEARLATPAMSLTVDPAEGGAVTDWSLFALRVNLLDTLSRRPEPYHAVLQRPREAAAPASQAPSSIHDAVGLKDARLETTLIYDDHRRTFFLDYGLRRMPTLDELAGSRWEEERLWSPGRYAWQPPRRAGRPEVRMTQELATGRIRKTVRAAVRGPSLECVCRLEGIAPPVLGLEFNLGLRDARWLDGPGQQLRVSRFEVSEPALGVTLRAEFHPPATVAHYPIETISESEAGLERTYQGLCVMCFWTPGEAASWTGRVRWSVHAAAA